MRPARKSNRLYSRQPDHKQGIPCGESLPKAVSRQSMRRQQSSSKSCYLPLPHRLYWTSQHPRRSSDTKTREGVTGFFALSVPGGRPDSHARPLLTPDDGLHQEFLLSYLYPDNGYGSILEGQKPGTDAGVSTCDTDIKAKPAPMELEWLS